MLLEPPPSAADPSDSMDPPTSPTSPESGSAGSNTASGSTSAPHPGLRARLNSALAGLNSLSVGAQAKAPSVSGVQKSIGRYHTMISHGAYPDTVDLQLAITAQGNAVKATDGLGRDELKSGAALEKWGTLQEGAPEVVISTQEFASLRATVGDLYAAHARALEQARVVIKEIRNYENELVVRRRFHATLTTKLAEAERKAAAKPDSASTLEIAATVRTDHADSAILLDSLESGLREFRRDKLKESFALEVAAYRGLGEKLVSVGAYGESLVQGLERGPGVPPSGVGEEVYAGWEQGQGQRVSAGERWTPTPSRHESDMFANPAPVAAPPVEHDPWRDSVPSEALPRYESGAPTGAQSALMEVGEHEQVEDEAKEKGRAVVREV